MRNILIVSVCLGAASLVLSAQSSTSTGYQMPPKVIADIMED